ncbi:hypothetical protein ACROYT_G018105 [Oculina patagonica]
MSKFGASVHSVKFVAMILLVALSLLISKSDGCTEGSCGDGQVCCGSTHGCIFASSCLHRQCDSDADCSRGESCCNDMCENATSCIGRYCDYDGDCSGGQSCCSNECRDSPNCEGFPCKVESDCYKWESCCQGTCSKSDCFSFTPTTSSTKPDHRTRFIIGTVVGSIVFGCLVSFCVHFGICSRKKSSRERTISEQRLTASASAMATGYPAESNTPCHGQAPQPYQQEYPYHLPPKYEQPQTTNPPPYNPGTTNGSEQPPSYSTTPQEKSGGVNTSLNAYGAVSNPSGLPV